jgi:hypothetical protein
MAHPNILVYQENETITPTVTPPPLPACIVGPAYHLRDYLDDKESIEVASYGTLNADNPVSPPPAFTPAITLTDMPDDVPGGVVVPDSIVVTFDDARVIMASGSDGAVTVDDNLFTSAGSTFVTASVRAGDLLIVDNPATPLTPNLVLTIREVVSETELYVTSNFNPVVTATGLKFRVERQVDDTVVPSVYVVPPADPEVDPTVILGDVQLTVDGAARVVTYARVYVSYRSLRTDLVRLDSVTDSTEIETKIGRVDARCPLAGLVSVAKQNAGDDVPIYFYGIGSDDLAGYMEALSTLSSEKNLYAFCYEKPDLAIAAVFRTSILQAADPEYANTNGTRQKFRVAMGSEELVTTAEVTLDTNTGTTEQAPGATPAAGVKTITLAGATLLSAGVIPGDLLILTYGSGATPINGSYPIAHINSQTSLEVDSAFPTTIGVSGANWRIYRPSLGADVISEVESRASLLNQAIRYYSKKGGIAAGSRDIKITQDATTPGGIQSIVEVIDSSTEISLDYTSGDVTAAMLVAAVNTGAGVTIPFVGSVNLFAETAAPATAISAGLATTSLSTGTAGVNTVTSTAVLDASYTRLFDAAATFITDGVIAGDVIEIPLSPNGTFDPDDEAPVRSFVVDTILSEQRLAIVNAVAGAATSNTSTREVELPHIDSREGLGPVSGAVTQGTIRYRVVRALTKDQQVTELASMTASLGSERNLLCWPDRATVTGLVDGSLARGSDGLAAAAGEQNGSYYAAAIAGMTSGKPAHQGFSTMSLTGVTVPESRRRYFDERQIALLGTAGWLVMVQETPSALPTVFHQVTTDPGTLETGEYSIIRTKDYVSRALVAVMEGFRGQWNNIPETFEFMRTALTNQGELLKGQRYAKIGAPLLEMTITGVGESTISADRGDAFLLLRIPGPLNVIALHLVFGIGA